MPRLRQHAAPSAPPAIQPLVLIGTILQALAAFAITSSMSSGPLRPDRLELAGVLLLAPLGAALFVWAIRSAPKPSGPNAAIPDVLVTTGAYAWLRHPIYLAFLALLLASGFLISAGVKLLLPLLLYVGGSELRIAAEEAELAQKFPATYPLYRDRTRWRYFPGLR